LIQFNERKRQEQVENLLTYKTDPIDIPKDLGSSKGFKENPWLKIELTKVNAFKVMTFGGYPDIKRKGRQPNAVKPTKEIEKIKKVKEIEFNEDDEEDEESEDSGKTAAKKRKMENDKKMPSSSFEAKNYLGEYSWKAWPIKMSKTNFESSPSKPVAEVPKEKTQEEKLGNLEKKENLDKKLTDMEERITDKY
jgi:hypothetical protein